MAAIIHDNKHLCKEIVKNKQLRFGKKKHLIDDGHN